MAPVSAREPGEEAGPADSPVRLSPLPAASPMERSCCCFPWLALLQPRHAPAPESSSLKRRGKATELADSGVVVWEDGDGPDGAQIFPCGRVLLDWLLHDGAAPALQHAHVLELGAGTGALAMGLAATGGGPEVVYAADGQEEVLENLQYNIAANALGGRVRPVLWDWEERQELPEEISASGLDFVVAADVVYLGTGEVELAATVASLCRTRGRNGELLSAFLLLADRPPGGQEFLPAGVIRRDPMDDPDTEDQSLRMSAVERFLAACRRRRLEVERLELDAEFVHAALSKGNAEGRADGELCLFRLQAAQEDASTG